MLVTLLMTLLVRVWVDWRFQSVTEFFQSGPKTLCKKKSKSLGKLLIYYN